MCMGLRTGFLAYKLGTTGAGKEEGRGSKKIVRSKGRGNDQNLLNICLHTSYHRPTPPPKKMPNLFD